MVSKECELLNTYINNQVVYYEGSSNPTLVQSNVELVYMWMSGFTNGIKEPTQLVSKL